MKKSWMILIVLVVVNSIYNIYLYINPDKFTPLNYLFNLSYGLIFLFGAIIGFGGVKKYGLKTFLGRSMGFFSLSLLAYFLGQIVWTIYNMVFKVDVPYPGIPDIFFLSFNVFSIIGFTMFRKSLGIKLSLKLFLEFLVLLVIFLVILYSYLQPSIGRDEPLLTIALNLLYPFLDSVTAALVIVGIRTKKGSVHTQLLIIAFSFLFMVFADTSFTYRTINGTYWNGGISDTLFFVGGVLFSWALLSLTSSTYLTADISGDEVGRNN